MTIDLTPQARRIINALLKTGLYGATEADVAERVFYEKLRELVATEAASGDEPERSLR